MNIDILKSLFLNRAVPEETNARYPGEYLERELQNVTDIKEMEDIAETLAYYRAHWRDDGYSYNNEQRQLIFKALDRYAFKSPVISAAIASLIKADETYSRKPAVFDREKYLERYEKTEKEAKNAQEMCRVVDCDHDALEYFKDDLNDFIKTCDPFEDEPSLRYITRAVLDKKNGTKLMTALARLAQANVTETSSGFKTLNRYFSKRQIRYLNLEWGLRGWIMTFMPNSVVDNVIQEAFEEAFYGGQDDLAECEKKLFERVSERPLYHNRYGEETWYGVLCADYQKRGCPKALSNTENWKFFAELFKKSISDGRSISRDSRFFLGISPLDFDPLEADGAERLKTLGNAFAMSLLSEHFKNRVRNFSVPEEGAGLTPEEAAYIPEEGQKIDFTRLYLEKDKKDAKRLADVCREVFGDDFLTELFDRYGHFSLMTFLIQTGACAEPEVKTRWIQWLEGQYLIRCVLDLYEKTGTKPLWLAETLEHSAYMSGRFSVRNNALMRSFTTENVRYLTEEERRSYAELVLDAVYEACPARYIMFLFSLYAADTSYKNEKTDIRLSDFFTKDEISSIGNSLKGAIAAVDFDEFVLPHLVDSEGYAELKKKQEEEEAKKTEEKKREKIIDALKQCEANHFSTGCLWTVQYKMEDNKKAQDWAYKKIIDKLIETYKRDNNARLFIEQMSRVAEYVGNSPILLPMAETLCDVLGKEKKEA